MKPKEYYATAIKFYKYTNGLDLSRFVDWELSLRLNYVCFKMVDYLKHCESLGLRDNESIEEFNLRYYQHGDRVNALIKAIIK